MRRSRLCLVLLSLGVLLSDCGPVGRHRSAMDAAPLVAPPVGPAPAVQNSPPAGFATPLYFPGVTDDTFYNTVGPHGGILTTTNDSTGVDGSCTTRGSNIAILSLDGSSPAELAARTVNCMTSFGPRGSGPPGRDGCSWKSGGITRVGRAIYLAVARQLRECSRGTETNGIQPSYNASIIKSLDGGRTWTNPWGTTSRKGAAPPWDSTLHRYRAMFPGRQFSAPFFIQYGPGNTRTVDGANKYLYAVSTDGYAYNGNYLRLARVPLHEVQNAKAWQFYHGGVGGDGRNWTSSIKGATHVLQARHGLSQPAIQYVPSLKKYVLSTFFFSQALSDFPKKAQTPFTELRVYTAPKPWGPWTQTFEHAGQRNLWCSVGPCPLTELPGEAPLQVGQPDDWLGLYDPAIIQKFVFTRPLRKQALFICGDWKNATRYRNEHLNRLHVIPVDLTRLVGTD